MNSFHDGDNPTSIFRGYVTLNPLLVNEAWDAYDTDTRIEELSRLPDRLHVDFVNQLHLHLAHRQSDSDKQPIAG